jgi:hypothetical protein
LCWGSNRNGELGIGSSGDRNRPTAVNLGSSSPAAAIPPAITSASSSGDLSASDMAAINAALKGRIPTPAPQAPAVSPSAYSKQYTVEDSDGYSSKIPAGPIGGGIGALISILIGYCCRRQYTQSHPQAVQSTADATASISVVVYSFVFPSISESF